MIPSFQFHFFDDDSIAILDVAALLYLCHLDWLHADLQT